MNLLEVAGARPNFMKVAPVHRALVERGVRPVLVHTGQHYDPSMSEVFLRDLGLPDPDAHLGVGSGSHAEQTAGVLLGLERVLLERRPDAVVVVGDVNSTLGAALAGAKLNVPVAHVEAGLRSRDRTMPEELNRVLTDLVADTLLAPSADAVDNLRSEGIPADRIFLVGNVMIDCLDRLLPKAEQLGVASKLGIGGAPYLVSTLHRPTNVDDDASLSHVIGVLGEVGRMAPVLLVTHPRTEHRLRETGMLTHAQEGLRFLPPMGYLEFLSLMAVTAGVLTDSGGIQEETTVLGIPCLTLRANTERPITVTEGTNEVVGLDRDRILECVEQILGGTWKRGRRPDLWDGNAGERVAAVLIQRYG